MNDQNNNMHTLNLIQIASWWLPNQIKVESSVNAVLPPIQRGFVWKSGQIEFLWDSITQGFPVGSLLLSEYSKEITQGETKKGHGSDGCKKMPTHYLLDGQQRATAISIGFRDIWSKYEGSITETLWVDLIPLENSERRFAFYLVTKSHPWGYSKRGNNSRISTSEAAKAMSVFQKINGKNIVRAHDLLITEVFPWDSNAPIPVPLLIKAITENTLNTKQSDEDIIKHLKMKLSEIKIWKLLECNPSLDIPQIKKAKEILDGKNNEGLIELISSLKSALTKLQIPAPVLSKQRILKESNDDHHDPLFTLFKRINTGGTTLSKEEINYSMLKAIWPEAPDVIEDKLLKNRQIAKPARLVSLLTRLSILTDKSNEKNNLPPEQSISQFRKYLNNDKGKSFKHFCEQSEWLLKKVWWLLTAPKKKYALPNILAAQMSRNSGDLLLLIMFWIHCIGRKGEHWQFFNDEQHKQTLGFLTAIMWFSPNIGACVKKLSKELICLHNEDNASLFDFFNNERFSIVVKQDDKQRVLIHPLPSPGIIANILNENIFEKPDYFNFKNNSENFEYNKTKLWHINKSIWDHLGGNNTPEEMISFYNSYLTNTNDEQRAKELWFSFFNFIFQDRRLLLYAQRSYITKWFNWYDPTLPDQIHDHNRPWDNDHILPRSWAYDRRGIYSVFPYLVRIWINSNGNFRLWPLESNRIKGNKVVIEDEIKAYALDNKSMVYDASFINKQNQKYWAELEDKNNEQMWEKKGDNNYNNKFWQPGKHWCIFLEASAGRTVDIYKEWYEQLSISELMRK